MTGRYYISPSKLYSIVRAYPGTGTGARGQVYDVPVVGDWVTIAVVAERSPIRVSRAPVALVPGEARDADDPGPIPSPSAPPPHRGSKSGNKDPPPRAGRKYVNLTLIDFGVGGKKGTSRGDAALSLLLFESDSCDTVSRGDGLLPEKMYKGGGRGAFEAMAKLREGTVIALLNPRVLKPIQVSAIGFTLASPTNNRGFSYGGELQKPGASNVLALTPESAASTAVIGMAQDLGMCSVVKRDGKPCGSWCDKRVSEVCDYHVQHAVERRRAARSEFSTGCVFRCFSSLYLDSSSGLEKNQNFWSGCRVELTEAQGGGI
jgi:minichromosome maintenance protein 10